MAGKQALYAIIVLYVSGLVVDSTLEGAGTVRTALIVTGQAETVAERILSEMERGVTILNGTGAYTGTARPVLYCVVSRSEVQQLKTIVHEMDPKAFMVIGQAHEALGEGFQSFKKPGSLRCSEVTEVLKCLREVPEAFFQASIDTLALRTPSITSQTGESPPLPMRTVPGDRGSYSPGGRS